MGRSIQLTTTLLLLLVTLRVAARAADVPYLTGGVGVDERAELGAKEKDYSLKIVAAKRSGDYLAGVKVVLESATKETVLDTTMDGPILLARLPAGTYTIKATAGGETVTATATIEAQGLRQVDVRF